jgi:hypothetical protein
VAYAVTVSGEAAREIVGMPAAARIALTDVLEQVADDPWSGDPYDPRWSAEFRTIAFGSGGGLATYVVSERRRTVLVVHVIWTG